MRSPSDPVRRYVMAERAAIGVGVASAAVMAWWALTPPELSVIDSTIVLQQVDGPTASADVGTFDRDAFAAVLWNPVQTDAVTVAAPPPPPPRLRIELIAITSEKDADGNSEQIAWVYLPDSDELRRVRAGESIASAEVREIDGEKILLAQDGREAVLSLDAGGG